MIKKVNLVSFQEQFTGSASTKPDVKSEGRIKTNSMTSEDRIKTNSMTSEGRTKTNSLTSEVRQKSLFNIEGRHLRSTAALTIERLRTKSSFASQSNSISVGQINGSHCKKRKAGKTF